MTARDGTSIPYVLDVTLRDGGYVNQHSWTLQDAVRVAAATAGAGVPGVEVGYFRPQRHETDGPHRPSACCPESYLERLRAEVPTGADLVVMVHRRDVELTHYKQLADLGVGVVRLPVKLTAIDAVREHVDAIHDAGMRATVNIIRISELSRRDVARAAAVAETADADVVYLADSNGSLFPPEVTALVDAVRAETDRPVGFHAHDGLSLAFGNSIAAFQAGATYLDASLGGMGKGGGNLVLELISGYLRSRLDVPIDVAPLAQATHDVLAPWRGDGSLARCESIVSSLLNLNLDDISNLRGDNAGTLLHLLDRVREPQPVLPS